MAFIPPGIPIVFLALGFVLTVICISIFIPMYIMGASTTSSSTSIPGCTWASTLYTRNMSGRVTSGSLKLEITRCGAQRRAILIGNGTLNTAGGAITLAAGAFPVADLPKFHDGDGIHKHDANCWMHLDATAQVPAKIIVTIASDGSAAITTSMVFDMSSTMAAGKTGPVFDDYEDGIDDGFDSEDFRINCQMDWLTSAAYTAISSSSLGLASHGKYKYNTITAYLNRTGAAGKPISQIFHK